MPTEATEATGATEATEATETYARRNMLLRKAIVATDFCLKSGYKLK